MSYNPDTNKTVQVVFSRKIRKLNDPSLTFSGTSATQTGI